MAAAKASFQRHHEPGLPLARMPPAVDLTREQFFQFCQLNSEVRIERTADGEITVMPPTGGEAGARNMRVGVQVAHWADADGSGVVFDSSTGFELPNGAVRSPDVAWVLRSRLARLSTEEKRRFLPLCPDFIIELCSPSDSLAYVERKMQEYQANGARLGWLIDPDRGRERAAARTSGFAVRRSGNARVPARAGLGLGTRPVTSTTGRYGRLRPELANGLGAGCCMSRRGRPVVPRAGHHDPAGADRQRGRVPGNGVGYGIHDGDARAQRHAGEESQVMCVGPCCRRRRRADAVAGPDRAARCGQCHRGGRVRVRRSPEAARLGLR